MQSKIDARLRKLEQAKPEKGWRNFRQDLEDPTVFWEITSTSTWQEMNRVTLEPSVGAVAFSKVEIDALSADGWQCCVMVYADGEAWRSPGDTLIQLSWGDE